MKKSKPILNSHDFILARHLEENKDITIKDYERFRDGRDKDAIADLVFYRLYGRYLHPFMFEDPEYVKNYKNGFAIMANCCLLIETLVSFKNGWGDSRNKEREAFIQFFKNNKDFGGLENKGEDFYKNVRCGILHQGETTEGWRISRKPDIQLFDTRTKTINAFKFSKQLKKFLKKYADGLKESEWDSEAWDNCRTKMRKIMKNCEA